MTPADVAIPICPINGNNHLNFHSEKKIIKNMNPKDLVQIILYYISAICLHFFHKLSIWQSLQNLFWSILPPLLARYVYMYEIEHTQLYVIYSLPLRYMTVTIMRITLNNFINLIILSKDIKFILITEKQKL